MLTATHIETALKAAKAGWGLVMPAADIAKAFNDAILTYGEGQFTTKETVAALVSECMMESAYFRTTEEYNKTAGEYQPFRGRTFIQITWQSNYLKFGLWCKNKGLVNDANYFVNNPARLADLKWAAIGGVWYFTQVMFHGKPLTAYSGDIDQVGKAVNMGDPFSKYTPNGHVARKDAYIAVLALGASIIPQPPVVVPIVPKPVTPKPVVVPPKENVMYSSQWKTNYVRWRGGNFAPITVTKLSSIPSYAGVVQGGLSFAPASAMTHAGIGAGDLSVRGMTRDEVWQLCKELWQVDIIPCPRGFTNDSFQGRSIANINDGNEHIHFLDLDCVDSMHWEAKAQVREVLAGGDGLLGNAAYTGPSRNYRVDWSKSKYNPINVAKAEAAAAAAKLKKELELPTTAEVAKALSTDKNFLKAVGEAAMSADVIANEFTGNVDNKTVGARTALSYLGKNDKAQTAALKRVEEKLDQLLAALAPKQ